MPVGSTLTIYSLSGEKVFGASENAYRVEWDGRTPQGAQAGSGIYYYVVRLGKQVLLDGTLLIIHSE
jgi:hypothetical protein